MTSHFICPLLLTLTLPYDTTILTSGSTVQEVELRLNLLASDVSSWANLNRMALNASKT